MQQPWLFFQAAEARVTGPCGTLIGGSQKEQIPNNSGKKRTAKKGKGRGWERGGGGATRYCRRLGQQGWTTRLTLHGRIVNVKGWRLAASPATIKDAQAAEERNNPKLCDGHSLLPRSRHRISATLSFQARRTLERPTSLAVILALTLPVSAQLPPIPSKRRTTSDLLAPLSPPSFLTVLYKIATRPLT